MGFGFRTHLGRGMVVLPYGNSAFSLRARGGLKSTSTTRGRRRHGGRGARWVAGQGTTPNGVVTTFLIHWVQPKVTPDEPDR